MSKDDLENLKTNKPLEYRDEIMKDKSLHWLPEDEDGDGKITIDTMLKCYDEAVKISAELSKSEDSATIEV